MFLKVIMLLKEYVFNYVFNVYCHESRHSKFRCILTMINKVSLSLSLSLLRVSLSPLLFELS